jgi:hypothetical protein
VRLRIDQLALVGTSRTVGLQPGLNVILGPMSTGKTSLMQLLRVFLGSSYSPKDLPEVKATVSELAGRLVIGDQEFSVRRPLVTTPTASVEIAGGDDEVLALPAMTAASQQMSYGDWLIGKLSLPVLRVPSAPTKPEESEQVKVSISDYLRYCRLTEDQIDTDVLGSSLPFSDYKRRVVFRILYGAYDTEVVRLQQGLRELGSEIRRLEGSEAAGEAFLEGTSFENRAAVDRRLAEVEEEREALVADSASEASEAAEVSQSQKLQERAAHLDRELANDQAAAASEREAAENLVELRNQLETQSARLTRAIVSGEAFFDFDFRVCPRCGNEVAHDRVEEGCCYLCAQPEPTVQQREDLVREQARITTQIAETEDLITDHERSVMELEAHIEGLSRERQVLGRQLDEVTAGFVSDRAEVATRRAADASRLAAERDHLREYLGLFERQESLRQRLTAAVAERDEIETALEQAEAREGSMAEHLKALEEQFGSLVETIEVPRFDGDPQPRAAIDHHDYQPIVNGRKIHGLSAGTRVLVNVAHLLAHHIVAPAQGVHLPGLLLIDGMTANIGRIDYDAERIEDIWGELLRLNEAMANDLQIVVAVNELPEKHDVADFVRLELSEDDRLVPTEDLARAREVAAD